MAGRPLMSSSMCVMYYLVIGVALSLMALHDCHVHAYISTQDAYGRATRFDSVHVSAHDDDDASSLDENVRYEEALRLHTERVSRTKEDDRIKLDELSSVLDIDAAVSTLGVHSGVDSLPMMYSGFLRVGGSNDGGALHYFFSEANKDADTAPLVLWLNGGPGASSFGGSILENGPLILNRTGSFMLNPWSWTNEANMLFLESPPGVGFSYCAAQTVTPSAICYADDYTTVEANLDALREFLFRYPEYAGRDFYITGESYAGVYGPMLAKAVYESELYAKGELVLQGYAVGDPCTDNEQQESETDFPVSFALRHSVITEELFYQLQTCIDMPESGICQDAQATYQALKLNDNTGPQVEEPYFDGYNVYGVGHMSGQDIIQDILCDPAMMKALHVNGSPNASPECKWSFETELDYFQLNLACSDIPSYPGTTPKGIVSISDIYRDLARSGDLRIVLYNGDTDPCIPTIASQRAAYNFGLGVVPGGEWRPWIYNDTGATESLLMWRAPAFGQSLSFMGNDIQLGGYVVDFEDNFSYVTVHGAGHMVPEYLPQAALEFFRMFISGEPFAPPLRYPAIPDIDAALEEAQRTASTRMHPEREKPKHNVDTEKTRAAMSVRLTASMDDDAVDALPGVASLSSKHYSGFLPVHGVNEGGAIHYWHVEASEVDPETAPLVVWLTGGPGGSSIGAFLTEMGPLILNRTGDNIIENPYAWSTQANMLWLESPPGVGYSYCTEQLDDPNVICSASDETTAAANLDALRAFLSRFPQYEGRDFFITGESYAGVYVPTLSQAVYESELMDKLNFLGWADGDPCTDESTQAAENGFTQSFSLRHGVIDEVLSRRLALCIDRPDSLICKRAKYQYAVAKGNIPLSDATKVIALFDSYNVYGVAEGAMGSPGWSQSHEYMTKPKLMDALHVSDSPNAGTWYFETPLNYTKTHLACNANPKKGEHSIVDIYQYLAPKLRNVILYNGDVDPSVDQLGSQRAVVKMGFPISEDWRPWLYERHAAPMDLIKWKFAGFGEQWALPTSDQGKQIGGYVQTFIANATSGSTFTYMTFHGSGHMVPEYKPEAALYMFTAFLNNDEYAPPLDVNMNIVTKD